MRLRRRPTYSIKLEVYASGNIYLKGGELGLAYEGTVTYLWALDFITAFFFDGLSDATARGAGDNTRVERIDPERIEIVTDTNSFESHLAMDKRDKVYLPPGMAAVQSQMTHSNQWSYVFASAEGYDSGWGRLYRLVLILCDTMGQLYPSSFSEQVLEQAHRYVRVYKQRHT